MCDLDEEQINQLFLKYFTVQRDVGNPNVIDHQPGVCPVESMMKQTFCEIVQRFKQSHQENGPIEMSWLNVIKRTENGEHVWRLYFAFIKN